MEQMNIKPEAQEQQTDLALRPWVTPAFERVPMKEALYGGSTLLDGVYEDMDFYYS
jgi:hypothetical protein